MVSTTLRKLIRLTFILLSLSNSLCHASGFDFGTGDSDSNSPPVTSTDATRMRFDSDSEYHSPANSTDGSYSLYTSPEGAPPTVADDIDTVAESHSANDLLGKSDGLVTQQKPIQQDDETMGFVTVANTQPEFTISDATFRTLTIPQPISPFTHIVILGCTCFNPIDSASFQNNPVLTHLVLKNSHLNFAANEEKLGEGCSKLEHIDLRGTADRSIDKDNPITPERFAQLIHPDVLLRILNKKCTVLILNPAEEETCYTLDEMKPKFLQSVTELRSSQESQKSVYQQIIAILSKGIKEFDSANLAGFGVRAAIKAYTGM